MKLYFTHIRDNDDTENHPQAILSDVPFNQIQNTSFMAQSIELGTDNIMPYIWVFVTGQRLLETKSRLDISRATIVSEQEMNVGNINAFYQYKATLANGEIYNLLLSNPDCKLNRSNDYIIANVMFHGKVGDLSAGMFDGATIVRFKDIEGFPEDDPEGVSYDKLILAESNEESNVSNTASLKIKDKNGNWVDVSGISVRTHGGSITTLEANKAATIDVSQYSAPVEVTPTAGKDAMGKVTVTLDNIPSGADLEPNKATTLYCYSGNADHIYTTVRDLVLGIDISNSIATGYRGGAIYKPDMQYSVVKVHYDENQGKYVLDTDGDILAILGDNGFIYVREDSSGDVILN